MICRRDPAILWHYLTRSPGKIWPLARIELLAPALARRAYRSLGSSAPRPHLFTLQVDNRCNLRCVQCWEWGREGAYKQEEISNSGTESDTDQWLRFIATVSRWRPFLFFFGGEPFLREDIVTLLEAAAKRCPTAINTNATRLTPEVAESVVRAGLDYLIASLDGPEAVNNKIRIGNDTFRRATQGIRHVIEARRRLGSALPIVELIMTVTTENQNYLVETAEIAEELNVDIFSLQFGAFTTGALWEATREKLGKSFRVEPTLMRGYIRDTAEIDADSIDRQLSDIRRRRWKFRLKRYPGPSVPEFSPKQHFATPEKVHADMQCLTIWRRMHVQADGRVGPCMNYPEILLGNVHKDALDEIWNGKAMREFRQMMRTDGLLPSCSRCCELYELGATRHELR